MKKSYAVILAAGSGTRMGGAVAKQYQLLGERSVLYYSVRTFEESAVDGIVLVTADGMQEYVKKEIVEKYGFGKVIAVTAGGKARMDSVCAGLRALPEEGIVLIHDGARPFVTAELIGRLLTRMEGEAACIPAVPVRDTIKRARNGAVIDTPERSGLFAVQTPQAFELGVLRLSFQKYREWKQEHPQEEMEVTDDAMLVEKMLGRRVAVENGDARNIKLTTPEDRIIAEAFLAHPLPEEKPEYLYHGS